MIKSVSLIIAGLLLLLPGFFTDFLGLAAIAAAGAKAFDDEADAAPALQPDAGRRL